MAGRVTADLVESKGSLPLGFICMWVTVGLVGGGGSPPLGS